MNKFEHKYKRRLCRAKKIRSNIKRFDYIRLSIHKTSKHIYASLIDDVNYKTIITISTLNKELSNKVKYTGNMNASSLVGKAIALAAFKNNIKQVAFDRSGFKYHGRISALADAARNEGLII
jgi:large subunit ribosomal protein L18